jgi:hypothetical protein
MKNTTSSTIEAPDRRRLALEAEVHEQTLVRFLNGYPVRALSRRRILRAAAMLEIALPNTKASAPANSQSEREEERPSQGSA